MPQPYKCNRSVNHDNVRYEEGQVILLDIATAQSLLQIDAIKPLDDAEAAEATIALPETDAQLAVLKDIAESLREMADCLATAFGGFVSGTTIDPVTPANAQVSTDTNANANAPAIPVAEATVDAAQANEQAPAAASSSESATIAADATAAATATTEAAAEVTIEVTATAGQDASEQAANEFGENAWPAATSDEETATAVKKTRTKKAE